MFTVHTALRQGWGPDPLFAIVLVPFPVRVPVPVPWSVNRGGGMTLLNHRLSVTNAASSVGSCYLVESELGDQNPSNICLIRGIHAILGV